MKNLLRPALFIEVPRFYKGVASTAMKKREKKKDGSQEEKKKKPVCSMNSLFARSLRFHTRVRGREYKYRGVVVCMNM